MTETTKKASEWRKIKAGKGGGAGNTYEHKSSLVRLVLGRAHDSAAVKEGRITVGRRSWSTQWYTIWVARSVVSRYRSIPTNDEREWFDVFNASPTKLVEAKVLAARIVAGEQKLRPRMIDYRDGSKLVVYLYL
jgi:hypothetical protein